MDIKKKQKRMVLKNMSSLCWSRYNLNRICDLNDMEATEFNDNLPFVLLHVYYEALIGMWNTEGTWKGGIPISIKEFDETLNTIRFISLSILREPDPSDNVTKNHSLSKQNCTKTIYTKLLEYTMKFPFDEAHFCPPLRRFTQSYIKKDIKLLLINILDTEILAPEIAHHFINYNEKTREIFKSRICDRYDRFVQSCEHNFGADALFIFCNEIIYNLRGAVADKASETVKPGKLTEDDWIRFFHYYFKDQIRSEKICGR